MLRTFELTKRYKEGVLGLDRLNLGVGPGQIYCLLGANGAGKTTTINLLLDFIAPTSGRATVCGLDTHLDARKVKQHIAFVPENVMFYSTFTARQNLAFFSRLGRRESVSRAEVDSCLAKVGIPEEARRRSVSTFSKGMRQRLAIAVVILKAASVIILDEPTSGLDPEATVKLVNLLQGFRAEGRAIFVSTHDIFRAKQLADRVGIMKGGRLVAEVTRDELLPKDLERLYIEVMKA